MPIRTFPLGDGKLWHERRAKLVNASEQAALHGVHKYLTVAQLAARKRDMVVPEADPESPLIKRGHALEDDCVDEIRKLRPTWLISRNEYHYVDSDARMGATPDYIAIDPEREGVGCLQIKVVAQSIFKKEWPDETPPLSFLLQLSQEMMLLPDCTWGALGVLVVGEWTFEGHLFPVDRNRSVEQRLREATIEFWRRLDAGDMPVVDFERDGALIALMFPNEVAGKVIDLSTDNAIGDLLGQRETLRETIRDVEGRLKAVENEIRHKLGDAEAAIVPGWRVTLKTTHRAAYNVEPSSFRVLRTARIGTQQGAQGQ